MPSVPNNAINLFSTNYGIVTFDGVGAFTTVAPSASGNVLTSNGSKWVSSAPATSGTVTSVSVVSANGLAGTVATSTSTPAITLSTTITGVLSGNGTAITGSSITQFDVLVGGASNAISSVGPGTSGQILQSAGNAANPAYSTSTYPTTNAVNTLLYASSANVMAALATATTAVLTTSSGVPTWASELSLALGGTNANLTASNGGIFYSTASAGAILSGTATASKMLLSGASTTPTWSTSTIPTSAGATANKVLLSDGTNYVLSTPTFPNASATTGNIIISDGTNWIASTPTYPAAAGSSGNVLTSNGTNWTSAAPATSGTVTSVSVVSANGFAGTVATATSTPAITLSTTITGVLSGNGTAISGSALTQHGVLIGGATNAITSSSVGATGTVLAGNTGSDPTFQTISSLGGITTITGNSGGAESPSSGNFNILGGTTGLTFAGTAATETLTGTLVLANGGTSASLTASNGGIFYSTASAGAILAGTATARQMLQSAASTTPAWSTSTWPATTTINQLLYSSSANTVAGLATSTTAVLTTSSGVPTWAATLSGALGGTGVANTGLTINLGSPTTGYVLTSDSSGNATWQAASGGGITTINGNSGSVTGSTITISNSRTQNTLLFSGSGTTLTLNTVDTNNNIVIGASSGKASPSGFQNCCLGYASLTAITSGNLNTCVGSNIFQSLAAGGGNTSIGADSSTAITGSNNTVVGYTALATMISGARNSVFGVNAGGNYAGGETDNICINSPGIVAEANTLHIGAGTGTSNYQLNQAFISGIQGITVTGTAVLVSSGDQLGVAVSSRKYKENIVDMGDYSSDILKLRPVTFTLKGHEDQTIQSGLIAEEVHDIFPDIMVYDKNGDPQTVQYHNLPALLLNELQKALKRIEALEAKI